MWSRLLWRQNVRRFSRQTQWRLVWTLVVAAILLGVTTLSAIGFETGISPLLTGAVWAVLPVPFYLLLVLWLDRHELEPVWALAAVFFWGAFVATFFALAINTYGQHLAGAWLGPSGAAIYAKCVSAPVIEEVAKAAAILLFLLVRRQEFDGVVDGMVYASLVGLGFATTENVLYYARAAQGGDPLTTFIARGVFMPYAHPLFTCLTGIGIGLAATARGKMKRAVIVLVGLTLAVCVHAFWNTSVYLTNRAGGSPFFTYLTVMMPLFLMALIISVLALRDERRVLRRHLLHEVEAGLLSADEHAEICTFRGRNRAAAKALRRGGVRRLRLQLQINRAAGELAFQRNRISRRAAVDVGSHEREARYLERLVTLRSRVKP
jgi:RsiW-degrading membrane proteinase PrsW (M82 family)